MTGADKDALFKGDLFFKLPVAADDEFGIMPLVSPIQPTGFNDVKGNYWYAILDDNGRLKRKQMI